MHHGLLIQPIILLIKRTLYLFTICLLTLLNFYLFSIFLHPFPFSLFFYCFCIFLYLVYYGSVLSHLLIFMFQIFLIFVSFCLKNCFIHRVLNQHYLLSDEEPFPKEFQSSLCIVLPPNGVQVNKRRGTTKQNRPSRRIILFHATHKESTCGSTTRVKLGVRGLKKPPAPSCHLLQGDRGANPRSPAAAAALLPFPPLLVAPWGRRRSKPAPPMNGAAGI
jgi:hypothetical protein